MNKKWECYNNNIEEVQKIAKNFNVSNLLATILSNKNISSENEIEKFLNPTRNDFYDPFLMPDMKIAVDRILEAMSKKEKIIIYGDYDVDGITSITVLKQFLEDRGIEVVIPKVGNIVTSKGEVIGKHTGLYNYTIGQRKGLGISYKSPLFVIGFNPKKNEVIVGEENELSEWKYKMKRGKNYGRQTHNRKTPGGRPPFGKSNLICKSNDFAGG